MARQDWQSMVANSVGVAAVLITRDTRKPGYHIMGWRTLNPALSGLKFQAKDIRPIPELQLFAEEKD